MDTSEELDGVDPARAPRIGIRLMVVVFAGLALVAIYANVQKMRRNQIETVTIVPASTATPGPVTGKF